MPSVKDAVERLLGSPETATCDTVREDGDAEQARAYTMEDDGAYYIMVNEYAVAYLDQFDRLYLFAPPEPTGQLPIGDLLYSMVRHEILSQREAVEQLVRIDEPAPRGISDEPPSLPTSLYTTSPQLTEGGSSRVTD